MNLRAAAETAPHAPGSSSSGRDDPLPTAMVGAAAAAIVALVWIPSIGRSLWLDELISTWVIDDGFTTAIGRAQDYQASSPLYFGLLWLWAQIVGTDEVLLRLPSIVCAAAALWHVNRLGHDLGSIVVGRIANCEEISLSCLPTPWELRPYSFAFLLL